MAKKNRRRPGPRNPNSNSQPEEDELNTATLEGPEDEYDEDDDEYDDDIDEDEEDEEEGNQPNQVFNEDVLEVDDSRPATKEEALAATVWQLENEALDYMKKMAALEQEMASLRKEVADTRIAALQVKANKATQVQQNVLQEAGLAEGDQIKPDGKGGWLVIPKKVSAPVPATQLRKKRRKQRPSK